MSNSEPMPPVRLTAYAEDESTLIEVFDGNLNVVPGSVKLGRTSVEVQPGAYAIRFQIGADYVQRIAILPPGAPETHIQLRDADTPRFATAAPVRHTTTTREYHRESAQALSLSPPQPEPRGLASDSHLLVFGRDLDLMRVSDPALGLSLYDLGGTLVADFETVSQRNPASRWAGAHYALPEGAFRLRLSAPSGRFSEQIVHLVRGWQTQVFLLVSGVGESEAGRLNLGNASVLMARPDRGFDPERMDLRWTESALRALSHSLNIPGSSGTAMLAGKFENPMLGIYAGLLHLRRTKIDTNLIRQVFFNLIALVGPLPDVLAIGWGLALRDQKAMEDSELMRVVRQPAILNTPPMLRASWDLLLEASTLELGLVPVGSFAERASKRMTTTGPWFSWRGELPIAEEVEAEPVLADSRLGGILGGLVPVDSMKEHRIATLDDAKAFLAKLLDRMPTAGHLIQSSRFTDVERRVAHFTCPSIDPRLKELLSISITSPDNPDLAGEVSDTVELVKSLKIPAGTALQAVWGLVRKLLMEPVVPDGWHLVKFVTEEGHRNKNLEDILNKLRDKPLELHHKRDGTSINGLAFIFLRYRGSPASPNDGVQTATSLAALLNENEYILGEKNTVLDVKILDTILEDLRAHVVAEIEVQLGRNALSLGDGWRQLVLPNPAGYAMGGLLPTPIAYENTESKGAGDKIAINGSLLNHPFFDMTPYAYGPDDSVNDLTENAAITRHTVQINGKSISYTARAGHLVAADTYGARPLSKLFYVAFTIDDTTPSTRPITFFYNGGIGSSSIFQILGSFGPRRVRISMPTFTPPAPYTLEDNQECLLDQTDMVFVSSVGMGYSSAIEPHTNKEFWGIDDDAGCVKQFIKRYLTLFKRWNSPKYLFGESFGTPSTCVLTWLLHEDGVDLNGIVLQSSILDYSRVGNPIGALPTLAADAWFHKKVSVSPVPSDLPAFMDNVEAFATGPYSNALAAFPNVDSEVLMHLSDILGVPPLVLKYWRLNPSMRNASLFLSSLLLEEGLILGAYDGRITVEDKGTVELDAPSSGNSDPLTVALGGAYTAMWNVYLNEELQFESESPYMDRNDQALANWSFDHVDPLGTRRTGAGSLYTAGDLAAAMAVNPYLRVFSANGYYDAVTPYFQTLLDLQSMPLDGAQFLTNVTVKNYPSGHTLYLDNASRVAMKADLASFYDPTGTRAEATNEAVQSRQTAITGATRHRRRIDRP